MRRRRAMTLLWTMTMQKVAWPATIVQNPGSSRASLMAESKAMPVMMPGSAIGIAKSTVSVCLPRKFPRASAKAASVPSSSAPTVAALATASDRRSAAHISLREKARSNQCSVRPGGGNWYVRSSVVNAYSRMISTGKCMNARPAYAATRALRGVRFLERIERSQAFDECEIQRDQYDRHHREGRGERDVSGRALLLIHHH